MSYAECRQEFEHPDSARFRRVRRVFEQPEESSQPAAAVDTLSVGHQPEGIADKPSDNS